MKLNLKTEVRSRKPEAGSRMSDVRRPTSGFRLPSSEKAVALVITLILLAVTLVMAVAFLAISRRERGSVTTAAEAVTARYAADSALANAEAEIVITNFVNPYNSGLFVSTNYINAAGFNSAISGYDPLNVSYNYANGNSLSVADFEQNLANLFYSPRPPVFVVTNQLTGATDFRFYLDLNRNGTFDDTSVNAPNVDNSGIANGVISVVGDPQWIGVLERPDAPYGPNNPMLARYCFIAIPADGALDLNAIHNQALTRSLNQANDGFMRNEGVGSWEINLAAFLADLNTNIWLSTAPPASAYYYYSQPASRNQGIAFEDALSLLSYRYNYTYSSLASGPAAFVNDGIDEYSDGALMTSTALPPDNNGINNWAGSDNTNHFFDLTADLFDISKITPTNFIYRLEQAGTNTVVGGVAGSTVSTYDRYTFYRLLEQLGSDSAPESGKMNVNYDNLDLGLNGALSPSGTASATNLVPWTPIGFFTNAADRLLRGYTGFWLSGSPQNVTNFANTYAGITNAFGVGNIPVLVNGRFVYTPTVNRLLQLAANMYDATYYTDHLAQASGSIPAAYLPSVFQPIFNVRANGDVYITNFVEVTDTNFLANPPLNLNGGPSVIASLQSNATDLVFGVPLIVGAKKGFPNFNAFAMQTEFGLERKLQVTRTTTNSPVSSYQVNQMFTLSLSNQLAVECWNSYTNTYQRPVDIVASDYMTLTLTNDEGFSYVAGMAIGGSAATPNGWPGFGSNPAYPYISTIFPVNTNLLIIPDARYIFNSYIAGSNGPPYLAPDTTNAAYEFNVSVNGSSYPQPRWGLMLTNDLQVVMVDVGGRIIDYVQLSGPNTNLDLALPIAGTGYNGMWDTNIQPANIASGLSDGINYQLSVSKDIPQYYPTYQQNWNYQDSTTVKNEIDAFRAFYRLGADYNLSSGAQLIAAAKSSLKWQVPYTPATNFVQYFTWQANDPLVHYLATDLNDTEPTSGYMYPLITAPPSDRYQPWNRSVQMQSMAGVDSRPDNLAFKDPPGTVYPGQYGSSDFWDFPTNKFPNIGWLGHVHRGTPWQTVFLKATNILDEVSPYSGLNTWENWTGNLNPYDAANAAPVQDRLLFDFFTTAPNDNATRGQLSINQPHLAAWSALLSGIAVPTNLFGAAPVIIQPAGVAYTNSPLGFMVQNGLTGINDTRANTNLFPQQVFTHLGDILAVHALNDQSPFLAGMNANYGVSDEMYEWLPQQTLSLLRVSSAPRYVIYTWGQALKPAPNAIVAGGAYSGMITNYQVVSEMATRAVVQVNSQVTTNWNGGVPTYSTNYSTQVEQFNILPPQ
jgi:hypothetical protein